MIKKSQIIRANVVTAIVFIFLCYMILAFIFLDFNILKWTPTGGIFFGVCCFFFIYYANIRINSDWEKVQEVEKFIKKDAE